MLVIACEVSTEKLPDFIQQLAGGQGRLSLEYMYHRDSLRSGTSYQNSGHINLGENCQVRRSVLHILNVSCFTHASLCVNCVYV